MMQIDLFAELGSPASPAKDERASIVARHADDIKALPEKLRPTCTPVRRDAELDDWTRTSQRLFLLWMIGAIARGLYTTSSMLALPGVLQKLNGLAGEW